MGQMYCHVVTLVLVLVERVHHVHFSHILMHAQLYGEREFCLPRFIMKRQLAVLAFINLKNVCILYSNSNCCSTPRLQNNHIPNGQFSYTSNLHLLYIAHRLCRQILCCEELSWSPPPSKHKYVKEYAILFFFYAKIHTYFIFKLGLHAKLKQLWISKCNLMIDGEESPMVVVDKCFHGQM